jgi:hypothetical protein
VGLGTRMLGPGMRMPYGSVVYHMMRIVILNIKLPHRATDDFISWSGEHSGLFSVRSAYRIGLQLKSQGNNAGQSSAEACGDRKIWDIIWKANVPPKPRVFAWRAASNSLGTQ